MRKLLIVTSRYLAKKSFDNRPTFSINEKIIAQYIKFNYYFLDLSLDHLGGDHRFSNLIFGSV